MHAIRKKEKGCAATILKEPGAGFRRGSGDGWPAPQNGGVGALGVPSDSLDAHLAPVSEDRICV